MPAVLDAEIPDGFPAENLTYLLWKAICVQGFGEESIKSGFTRLLHFVCAAVRCDYNHGRVVQAFIGSDLTQRLIPVFMRQAQVHQDKINARHCVGEVHHTPSSRLPFTFLYAQKRQQAGNKHEIGYIVLDHQDMSVFRVNGCSD